MTGLDYNEVIDEFFTTDILDTAIYKAASPESQTFYQEVNCKLPFICKKAWEIFKRRHWVDIKREYPRANICVCAGEFHKFIKNIMKP